MTAVILAFLFGTSSYLAAVMLFGFLAILSNGYTAKPLPFPVKAATVLPMRRLAAILRFPLELILALSIALALTVFDCAYLGGGMRIAHFLIVILGVLAAHKLYHRPLALPVRFTVGLVFDLLLYALLFVFLPMRLIFRLISHCVQKMLLIYKAKHDKIRRNRISAAYLKSLLIRSETAFLPRGAKEMLIEKTGGEKKNGSNPQTGC